MTSWVKMSRCSSFTTTSCLSAAPFARMSKSISTFIPACVCKAARSAFDSTDTTTGSRLWP
jgi:hypothetical protein